MPKMKSKRSAAKRFRVTGSGKFKFQKAGRRHLMSSKSTSRKRKMRETGYIDPKDEVHLKRMLPYSG
jgi:large subunit ribosomal protein L35